MLDQTPKAFKLASLNALKATGGPLKDAKVVLCADNLTEQSPAKLVPADITPITAGGYAGAETVTWGNAVMRNGVTPVLPGGEQVLTHNGSAGSVTVRSYAFLSADGNTLLGMRPVIAPVNLQNAGDQVRIDIDFPYGM